MLSFLWEDTRSISFKFWSVQRNTLNFGPCLKKTTGFTFFAVTAFLGCFSCWNITGMALICLNNVGFSVLLREVSTAQEHLPLSFLPFPFYPSTHYLSAYYPSMLSSIYLSGNLSSSQSFTCSNSGRIFVSASAFQSSLSLCFPRHCSLSTLLNSLQYQIPLLCAVWIFRVFKILKVIFFLTVLLQIRSF